ncbi:hypothetical protein BC629DRAFT_1531366 [Irpex lacteus]|nr:hypothetical protein BC629DRAFT_1531366 [Irpex lacteus]
MFHDTNARAAAILSSWFASLLYGMLVIVSVGYIRLVMAQGLKTRTDCVMCGLVVVQLLLSSFHNGLCLQQLLYGFIDTSNPEAYFSNQGQPSHVGQTATYLFNNLFADSVLVWILIVSYYTLFNFCKAWRLYIVYGKNRWIILPYGVLILGATTTCIGVLITVTGRQNFQQLFANTLAGWLDTYWGLTITTQVSASCLIAYKIWTTRRTLRYSRSSRAAKSMSVLWLVLESGALLSSTTVVLLSFYVTHKVAGGTIAAICGQLGALIPASILLRVSLNKVSIVSADPPLPSALVALHRDEDSVTRCGSDHSEIHVHQAVDVQRDLDLYRFNKQAAVDEA